MGKTNPDHLLVADVAGSPESPYTRAHARKTVVTGRPATSATDAARVGPLTTKPVIADLFMPLPGIDADVAASLDLLARSPGRSAPSGGRWWWRRAGFCRAARRRRRACSWDSVSLYGLSKTAPYSTLSAMGAASQILAV
jgi:hypothetical protein